MGPLTGVRVVDFTTTFLGPYCTMLMAQMGADVIKVESPSGDVVRNVGPARNAGMSATYLTINTGKRSVVVDLKSPEAQPVVERLVRSADVVIHNMRASTAVSLGLTYEKLSRINPRVIVAEAFGFAPDSPDADRPAYDDVIQAASGLADLESRRQGRPQYVTTILADKTCALVTLYGVMAALYDRERTGAGQSVVIPMLDSMVGFLLPEQMSGEAFIPNLGPAYYPRTTSKFRRPYETKDGYIGVVLYTDNHWRKFFLSTGRPELVDDPRFRDIGARSRNIDELYALVESVLRTETTEHWITRFTELDCPAAEVRTLDDLLADPYLRRSGTITDYEHPSEGRVRGVGLPVRFSAHDLDPIGGRHAPRLGEHTDEVLDELGFTSDEVEDLRARGAVRSEAAGIGTDEERR